MSFWRQSPIPMTQALSLYRDVVRSTPAFTVFLSRYAAGRYSGGLFWQVVFYGRMPVLVFFVLRDLSSPGSPRPGNVPRKNIA
jgi:hypothetical protein